MAGRIAGITIEIGGDATNLQKSLKGVDSQLKTTQSNLKDINKLLKLDPGNTELLKQKQKELKEAISLTKDRLKELKDAQSGVAKGTPEWDKLQREIIETEQNLKQLEGQYKEFGSVAKQQLQAIGSKLQESGQKIQDFGQKLAPVSAAATAIGGALLKMGYDAVTGADDLNTLSKQTGFTTAEIQKMQYAADRIDVSFDDIAGALKKFKSKIDPANETLKNLGVSVTDADGNLRDATDVFNDAVVALSKIENETERDQLAMELFGKSADSLAGIIDDGGAALNELGQEAENLGLILSQDTLDSLNETNDEIDKMKAQVKATMAVIGSKVVPVIAPIITKIGEFVTMIAEKLSSLNEEQTETILKVIGIVAAAAPAIIILGKIVSGVGTLISTAGSLLGLLGNPAVLIIMALVAAGILLYKNWDKIKAKAEEIKKIVSTSWNNLKTAVTTTMTNIKTSITTAWDNIKSTVSAKVEAVKNAIVTKFQTARDTVKGIIDKIKGFFNFEFTLPHIKLPHFKVEPEGWVLGDLLKGIIPELSIVWYKKAYGNPYMFTKPTLMGFGDGNGGEMVYGHDNLMRDIRDAVGGAGDITINVYASEGMDVTRLAYKVQDVLVAQQRQRSRAYA